LVKGDREHAVRRHADHLDQPADAVSEHARLAGTGAGEHQVVTGRGGYDVALVGIEFVEQVRDIHPAIVVATGILPSRDTRTSMCVAAVASF
jgi:hypothetical protein